MLDEPKILADFEISRWMGVGWALDTRWMEPFSPAKTIHLPIAEKSAILPPVSKNFFLVYRGAPVEQRKTTALTMC